MKAWQQKDFTEFLETGQLALSLSVLPPPATPPDYPLLTKYFSRAHVDLIFQKFDEDPGFSIHALDIAVNAVATSVKDFFFKRLPPLLPQVG